MPVETKSESEDAHQLGADVACGDGEADQLVESLQERQALEKLACAKAVEARLVERARMILLAADGWSNCEIAEELGTTATTVRTWRRRYPERRRQEPEGSVLVWLADDVRVGRPDKFDEKFWVDVLAIATSDPEDSGRPITHWTVRELTDELLQRKLVDSIHFTTVARFLRSCQLQPHRIKQWMNRKEDPEFDERAADVKECLVNATTGDNPQRVVVSFDEKTGMQAKERIAPDQAMRPGQPARLEFEYRRHGTLVLFGFMQVHSGDIAATLAHQRTNLVTAQVMTEQFEQLFQQGYTRIDVILDQLNTHWSEALVRDVARLCELPAPDDQDVRTGAQRRAWLTNLNVGNPDKAVVFHYTPKHASWLNPIEIWFGVLVAKVLRRGSFSSTQDLEGRIHSFIAYYNEKLAHPYRFKLFKNRKKAA